jgi:hypothetical protein
VKLIFFYAKGGVDLQAMGKSLECDLRGWAPAISSELVG